MKGAEGRWTTSENECMGVVFGLRKFRHLLYREALSVVTDNNALTWLMSLSDPKDRLARWVIEVKMFAFSVEDSPGGGKLMAVPDALSRDTMGHDLVFCGRCMCSREHSLQAQGCLSTPYAEQMPRSFI
jgi:RNase H-like domain found in reverse transcriptase